ncbi:hypothetical protein J8V57_13360, partial [Xenorhabdus sp. PB61.4]|uniref:hypothetical protein n=1 Tax=Xenorhabdus sp. PB61.4 TaxID=2788940 RepID=UPI001E3C9DE1
YVNTDSNGDINLKFFANKLEDTYVEKISISNIMDDITHSLQKNVLFITKNVTPSDNLANPIIINMNGDEVPPAGSDKNPTFDARIPRSATFTPTDYIYMMSDVNDATPMLCTSDRYGNRNFQDKPFKIPYKLFTPFQYNTLYYYLFTIGGDVFRSKNLAFTVSAGPNSYLPPKGNFKLPSILDHSGTEVDEFFVFGITSLGNGITCVIPTGGNKEVQLQDKIDCFVDIITYDPDTGNLKPKSTVVHSTTVTDVSNPLKISIQSSYLTDFGVDEDGNPTPFYIYYTVNKENYSQSWQGFLDTAPLDYN